MHLADFIKAHRETIFAEWETFARSIWPGTATDPGTLRDHVEEVLRATIADMRSAQTSAEQSSKSRGGGQAGAQSDGVDAASEQHGADRAEAGFGVAKVVAEYRALRASVLRLWEESVPVAHGSDLKDLTRFNESIDQSLTEALSGYAAHHRKCQDQLAAVRAERVGAEEANRAKDVFLATLSHEMRTPLNAIVGWLEILRHGECSSDELAEGLAVIDRNTKAQVSLIEDLLDLSRIVSGKLRLEMRRCDLAEVIQASVDAVALTAQARGVSLDLHLGSSPGRVTCDANRIQQVVSNLLSNAVKFTQPGGTVRISLGWQDAMARVEVQDDGIGISPVFLPHVFDRFRQADDGTRRNVGGLGLGLAIVKHLVELHGGTAEARSPGEGRGSTFSVCLPIDAARTADAPDDPGGSPGQSPPTTASPPIRLDGLRLLVVDDEPNALRILARLLTGLGATVTTADGAAAAIGSLATARADVLISDIGMPGQDGYDLIREVRRRGLTAGDLPAVALTAFVDIEDQRKALATGFQVQAPKPVNVRALTATIASLAGRAA
jgi:signal transduction histidine kinase